MDPNLNGRFAPLSPHYEIHYSLNGDNGGICDVPKPNWQISLAASQALGAASRTHSLASLKLCLTLPEANLSFRYEARLIDSVLLNSIGGYTFAEPINS